MNNCKWIQIKRINRKLAKEGFERLRVSRGEQTIQNLGEYFVLDISRNVVVDFRVDLDQIGDTPSRAARSAAHQQGKRVISICSSKCCAFLHWSVRRRSRDRLRSSGGDDHEVVQTPATAGKYPFPKTYCIDFG
jgi:hypothetical protein